MRKVVFAGQSLTASRIKSIFLAIYNYGGLVVVAATAFLLYLKIVKLGFLSDDFLLLKQLKFEQKNFSDSFVYFTRDWGMGINFYRPFTRVFFAAEYFSFGFNPAMWHLISLLLYVANTALLYWLVRRLTQRSRAALVAGLIFAVASTHVEPVNWIADQTELLALLFCLAGTIFYTKFRQTNGKASLLFYGLSLASFVLGLLNKESAAGFFLVPFAYDLLYWKFEAKDFLKSPTPGRWWQPLVRQIPFWGIIGLYLGLRIALFGGIGGYKFKETTWQFSLGNFINLNFQWLLRPLQIETGKGVVIFVVVVTTLSAGLWLWERGQARPGRLNYLLTRALLFGLAWVIIFLLPALSTPPSVRYVYISTAGVAIGLAVLFFVVADLGRSGKRPRPDRISLVQRLQSLYASPVVDVLKIGFLIFFFYIAVQQTRTVQALWTDTSHTMENILAQIKAEIPDPVNYGLIYVTGIPLQYTNEDAPPFQVGFNEAVQIQYNNPTVETLLVGDFPVAEARLNQGYFVEVQDGHVIRRDDVLETLKRRNQQIKDKKEQVVKTEDYNPAQKLNGIPTVALPRTPAYKLAGLDLTVRIKTPVQLKIQWLVDTPNGEAVRDTSILTVDRDGTFRVKPSNIALFSFHDTVSEIRIEVPGGVGEVELVQVKVYNLPG